MRSDALALRLEKLIRFGNLLVHQYGRVDDSRAHKQLYGESGDFYEFLEEVERFITSKRDGSGECQNHRGGFDVDSNVVAQSRWERRS